MYEGWTNTEQKWPKRVEIAIGKKGWWTMNQVQALEYDIQKRLSCGHVFVEMSRRFRCCVGVMREEFI